MFANAYNAVKSLLGLTPQAITSDTLGPAMDRRKYNGYAKAVVNVGAVTGTTPTLTIEIHHSDTTGGTYTLWKTLATTIAEVDMENKLLEYELELIGAKGFLKFNFDVPGAGTPNLTLGATLECFPRTAPANG